VASFCIYFIAPAQSVRTIIGGRTLLRQLQIIQHPIHRQIAEHDQLCDAQQRPRRIGGLVPDFTVMQQKTAALIERGGGFLCLNH
jgi:hypothetical protein